MNEFIEKNRRLFRFYCCAAQLLGSVLLILGVLWGSIYALKIASRLGDSEALTTELGNWPSGIFGFVLAGLVALAVAQFLKYLFEKEGKAGWILGNGDKVLYIYAVVLAAEHIWMYIKDSAFHPANLYIELLLGLLMLLFTAAKILALVGLGQILRRVMPVIEESKTLV